MVPTAIYMTVMFFVELKKVWHNEVECYESNTVIMNNARMYREVQGILNERQRDHMYMYLSPYLSKLNPVRLFRALVELKVRS
ncbi:hypothetical protein EDC96DRAFT_521421 [Choanephora cucurbitarum]|nr:hypothetical protein EDC96DRAFT_521421 [Choanephora cucurbitarum]